MLPTVGFLPVDAEAWKMMGPAKGGLEGALSSFDTSRQLGSSGGAVSVSPILRDLEAAARDARIHAKSVDDILQLVRQQVFDFRRWILSTAPGHLHAMIRADIYVRKRARFARKFCSLQRDTADIKICLYQHLLLGHDRSA